MHTLAEYVYKRAATDLIPTLKLMGLYCENQFYQIDDLLCPVFRYLIYLVQRET